LYPELISNIPHSLELIAHELVNTAVANRTDRLINEYKFPTLLASEIGEIEAATEYSVLKQILVRIISEKVKIQWTTKGNTVRDAKAVEGHFLILILGYYKGMDTYLYAAGHKSTAFKGTIENFKFGQLLQSTMAFDASTMQALLKYALLLVHMVPTPFWLTCPTVIYQRSLLLGNRQRTCFSETFVNKLKQLYKPIELERFWLCFCNNLFVITKVPL